MSRVADAFRRIDHAGSTPDVAEEPTAPRDAALGQFTVEQVQASPEPRADRPVTVPLSAFSADAEPRLPAATESPRIEAPVRTRRPIVRPERVEPQASGRRREDASPARIARLERSTRHTAINPATLIWSTGRALFQRKWLLLSAFAVMAVGSVLYLRATVIPVYRATARLTVESRTVSDSLLKPTADNGPVQGYAETLAEVMRSRWLAESSATTLELWKHREYSQPGLGPVAGTGGAKVAPSPVVDRFMAHTLVTSVPGSTVINISFSSIDPQLAASGANAMAKGFIQHDLESRLSGAKDAGDWIGKRLEEQRVRVTETEAALQRYRENQNASSLDDRQNMVVQRLTDLNSAVTKARTERIAKEELYRRVVALQGNPALLDSVPAVAASAYIQQLKSQVAQIDRQLSELSETYGELHPQIVTLKSAREETSRRLDAEIGKIGEALHNEFLTAQAQERRLDSAMQEQQVSAQDLDRKGVEYATLVREAESNRALYQSLLEQAKNVGLEGDLQRSHVRLLDEARPPVTPIGLPRRMMMLMALLASAVFAVGLAFVAEYVDPRLRTADEIPDQLQLPLLGYLEALRKTGPDRAGTLISDNDTPARFKEQVRRIRANIELENHEGGVVLSVSAEPNEGKTLVATNLALALAAADRRVLLIDADLRRSNVHVAVGMSLEPGLSTLLGRQQTPQWREAVRRPENTTLDVLTAGPTPSDPAELLGSDSFASLLEAVREAYDWVIVDTPPIMLVSDTQVLAELADQVVFVASADQTRRNSAKAAVEQLRRVKANVTGVVLNRVAIPRWGALYSGQYGGAYQGYYAPTTKQKAAASS